MKDFIDKYGTLGIIPQFPYKILDEKNDVEISIGIRDRIIFISFLGSSTIKDWLHNFMFWKKPYKKMEHTFFTHAGFLKIYKIARDEVHTFIEQNYGNYDKIFISGHSLGGAIATLCFEDVKFLQEKHLCNVTENIIIRGITTGAPRVFSIIGRKILKKRCENLIHLVYKSDGVPAVPPACMLYKHVGTRIQYGKRFPCFLFPSAVYYHDCNCYINRDEYKTRKENVNNNGLYKNTMNVYGMIYLSLSLLFVTTVVLLVI